MRTTPTIADVIGASDNAVPVDGSFWDAHRRAGLLSSRRVQREGLPRMHLSVPSSKLREARTTKLRSVTAHWFDSNDNIVAHAEMWLMGPLSKGRSSFGEEFIDDMDSHDEHAFEVATLLVDTHYRREPFFGLHRDAVLAEFLVLQLKPEHRGRGVGVQLGAQFLDEMRRRYKIAFILLRPFPLQYGARGEVEFDEFGFARDVAKLRGLYAEAWDARPLPGSEHFLYVRGSAGVRLARVEQGWAICHEDDPGCRQAP